MKGIILLANEFEDIEALATIDILRRADISITTVSMNETKNVKSRYNLSIKADTVVKDINNDNNIKEYDFLIIPGGANAVEYHRNSEDTKNIVKYFQKNKKLIATICAAPSILGIMGYLDNEYFTCFPSFEKYIPNGKYLENEKVVISNNHITSKAAGTTFIFAKAIVEYLTNKPCDILDTIFYN